MPRHSNWRPPRSGAGTLVLVLAVSVIAFVSCTLDRESPTPTPTRRTRPAPTRPAPEPTQKPPAIQIGEVSRPTPIPTQRRRSATASPTAVPPTATPEPTTTLPSPTATPTTTATPEPTSEPTPQPTPTPTSVLVPPPAGHLLSVEHGLALVQTTRAASETHRGWVDITLALAVTRFGTAASTIVLTTSPEAICFINTRREGDCLKVVWGTEEQFTAEIRSSRGPGTVVWPAGRTWPFSATFEVPEIATNAAMLFDQHRLALDLQGDQPFAVEGRGPSPAPTPPIGAQQGTSGYFLGRDHGLSIAGLRRAPNEDLPGWTRITVDLALLRLGEDASYAPTFGLEVQPGRVCLDGSDDECLGVVWGEDVEFNPTLELEPAPAVSDVPWPRGMGWPVSIVFDAPSGVDESSLLFADHRIPLDLAGMAGAVPEYRFRDNYLELATGSVVYGQDAYLIRLSAVKHDDVSGAIMLQFEAVNNAEATDFVPAVTASAARVSDGGMVLDGAGDVTLGWQPITVTVSGREVAPGQRELFEMTLPRVVGDGFAFLGLDSGPPGAVLIQLAAGELGDEEAAQPNSPSFVRFKRSSDERRFWLPDLTVTGIEWEPQVVTVGRDVHVTVTVQNKDTMITAPSSRVALLAGGLVVGEAEFDAISPGSSGTVAFTWKAQSAVRTFGATADFGGSVDEDSEANNHTVVDFGGAFLPDLTVEKLTWPPVTPSVGDTVTFTVHARNLGKGAGNAFGVHVSFDQESRVRWNLPLPALEGGESAGARFTWTAQAGVHEFKAVVDGIDRVLETDESNNVKVFSYEATALPDLVIDGLVWEPLAPSPDDDVTFTVTAVNVGKGRSQVFTVGVFLNDEAKPMWRLRFPELRAGGDAAVSFTWKLAGNSHTLKAVADDDQRVTESDETNNEGLAFM